MYWSLVSKRLSYRISYYISTISYWDWTVSTRAWFVIKTNVMSEFTREHDTNKPIILCKDIHYIPRLVRMISARLCLVAIWKHTILRICLGVSSLAPGIDDDDDDDDDDMMMIITMIIIIIMMIIIIMITITIIIKITITIATTTIAITITVTIMIDVWMAEFMYAQFLSKRSYNDRTVNMICFGSVLSGPVYYIYPYSVWLVYWHRDKLKAMVAPVSVKHHDAIHFPKQ